MIKLRDARLLAHTKLKSRRLTLWLTVFISGLTFAILFAISILGTGLTATIREYGRSVNDGKYLVKSTPVFPLEVVGITSDNLSSEKVDELRRLEREYFASQKAKANSLRIEFNEDSQEKAVIPSPFTQGEYMVNFKSPVIALYQYQKQVEYSKVATNKLSDLKLLGEKYGAVNYSLLKWSTINGVTTHYISDKEDLTKVGTYIDTPTGKDGFTSRAVRSSMYVQMDDALVKQYLLPVPTNQRGTGIPVVITTKEAVDLFEKKLNLPPRPADIKAQIEWYKLLRSRLAGVTYTACYRNQADANFVQKAINANSRAKQADNKTSLIDITYNLPDLPCGSITIDKDLRTPEQKKTDEQVVLYEKALNKYDEPSRRLLTFQIVGLMNTDQTDQGINDVQGLTTQIFTAKHDAGAIIPRQMYSELPESRQNQDVLFNNHDTQLADELYNVGIGETIVSFANIQDAKNFIQQGCGNVENCKKPFVLSAYGSNYLLQDNLQQTIDGMLKVMLPIAVVIASLLIFAMMTRVITDSRKETAIYRSMGATRGDIMQIYLLYSSLIAVRVLIFSILAGAAAACAVQFIFAPTLSDYVRVAYSAFDNMDVSFIGVDTRSVLTITLSILLTSLIASIMPIIRNVRRETIRDLRDE